MPWWSYEESDLYEQRQREEFERNAAEVKRAADMAAWEEARRREADAGLQKIREAERATSWITPGLKFSPEDWRAFSEQAAAVERGEQGSESLDDLIRGNVSPAGLGAGRGPFGGGLGQVATEFMSPLAPPEATEWIGELPVPGAELAERYAAGSTSPLALAFAGRFPVPYAAGTAGAVGLGTAGRGLEQLGVPKAELGPVTVGPGGVGEAIGGLATGGEAATGLRLTRAGGRAAANEFRQAAQNITQTARRLATEEAGGVPLGRAGEEAAQAPKVTQVIPEEVALTPAAEEGAGARAAPPGEPPSGVKPPSAGELPPPVTKARIEVQQERAAPPGKPPKKPPTGEGTIPPAEERGTLLARFLENQVDTDAARSDWAKFQGGLAAEGKEIDLWMQQGSKRAKLPTGGKRTPETEQLFLALHGEGPPPPRYQAVYDEISAYMREGERITLGDVPGFESAMLKDPTYFTRKWRNWQIFDDLAREARGEAPRGAAEAGRPVGLPGKMPKGLSRRTLPKTFSEALDMGAEPLTWNPYEMAAIHRAELAEYRYTNVLAQAWKDTKRAIPKSAAPRSWTTPPYRAFESRPYATADGTIGWSEPLVVSPEDAKILPAILGQGFEGAENAAAYLTSVFKRSKVALGLFQYWDLQNRTILRAISEGARLTVRGDLAGAARELEVIPAAAKAWAGAIFPPLRPKLWRAFMDDPLIKMGIEEGGQPIGGLDVWKRTMRDALKDDLVMKAPLIGDIPTVKIPPGLRQTVQGTQNVMNGIYRYIAGGLYDAAHPQYWGSFYKSLYRQLRTQFPSYTDRQIAGMAAKDTNIMMSSIPDWHSVLNPRLRQLGRGVAFSVNEGEAWVRMVPRALRGKTANIYRQQWAAYLFGTLATAEVINYAMTGELLSEDQLSPIVMKDGKPTYNGHFARPRLDGDGPVGKIVGLKPPLDSHLYLDLMGQADTPFRMLNPVFFIQTRLAPQLSTAVQELQSRRYFGGQPLETPQERATFAVEQLAAPIPLVGFGQERERIGTTGSVVQAAGWNVSAEGLSALLHRKYTEKTGKEWDDPNVGPNERQVTINADPELAAIQAEGQKRGVAMGSESAVASQTYRDAQAEWQAVIKQRINAALSGDPSVSRADVAYSFSDAAADLASQGEILFADTERPKTEGLAKGLAEYNAVELKNLSNGMPDYDSYYNEKDAILARYPGLEAEVRRGVEKRWTDPQVREYALAVFDAGKVRHEYNEIPRKRRITLEEQRKLWPYVQRVYAYMGKGDSRLKAVRQVTTDHDLRLRLLRYLKGRPNPERKAFKEAHPELDWFESLPIEDIMQEEEEEELATAR